MTAKRKWLRRTGLIVGVVGVAGFVVWGLFHYEGGPSRYAIPPLVVLGAPFLISLLLAWKWPLVGGITLGAIGLFWVVLAMAIVFLTPTNQPLLPLVFSELALVSPLALPPLTSGVLFLLYWRAERASLVREKS